MNLHTGNPDPKIEHSVLKTIAAFLNSQGGTILIGANDEGEILGCDKDNFSNEDRMALHLVNLVKTRLGIHLMTFVEPIFEDCNGKRVLRIDCRPSDQPVYMKDGDREQFFVRTGPATNELLPSQIMAYLKTRFGS